jgi:hypothetical protein
VAGSKVDARAAANAASSSRRLDRAHGAVGGERDADADDAGDAGATRTVRIGGLLPRAESGRYEDLRDGRGRGDGHATRLGRHGRHDGGRSDHRSGRRRERGGGHRDEGRRHG